VKIIKIAIACQRPYPQLPSNYYTPIISGFVRQFLVNLNYGYILFDQGIT